VNRSVEEVATVLKLRCTELDGAHSFGAGCRGLLGAQGTSWLEADFWCCRRGRAEERSAKVLAWTPTVPKSYQTAWIPQTFTAPANTHLTARFTHPSATSTAGHVNPPLLPAFSSSSCRLASSVAPPQCRARDALPDSPHGYRARTGREAEMRTKRRYGSPCLTTYPVESGYRRRAC